MILTFVIEAPKYEITTTSFNDLYIISATLSVRFIYRPIVYRYFMPSIEATIKIIEQDCLEMMIYKTTRSLNGLL